MRSSAEIHLPNDSVDLIFTSPPYWDIEFYDESEKQAGYKKTYEQFLETMQSIMNECHRILKSDKYCVININDFRKDGKYYDYHNDISQLGKKAGFKIHDVVIVDWGTSIQSCFATQIESRKMTAKRHEYLIVFKKG